MYISDQYHLSVKPVSRRTGRSSVGAAAYRAGEKLYNDYDGKTHNFTHRGGVAHTEIILTPDAPLAFLDRETLWNAAERAETRRDARTAREIEISLLNELTLEQQLEVVREFVGRSFIQRGMCADVAIHHGRHDHRPDAAHDEAIDDITIKKDNPHAHILLTDRPVGEHGFLATKDPSWKSRANVFIWRKDWADAQNKMFERLGLDVRVDHRSYAARGIDKEPTIHEGFQAREMEARGVQSDKGNANRDIRLQNEGEVSLEMAKNPLKAVQHWVEEQEHLLKLKADRKQQVKEADKTARLEKVEQKFRTKERAKQKAKDRAELEKAYQHLTDKPPAPENYNQDMLASTAPDASILTAPDTKQLERPTMPTSNLPAHQVLYDAAAANPFDPSAPAPEQSAPIAPSLDAAEVQPPAPALEGEELLALDNPSVPVMPDTLPDQTAAAPKLENASPPAPPSGRVVIESAAARRLLGQVMDLEDISAALRDFDGKLAGLSGRLHETGVLDKNRDYLAERIENMQNSRQQAIDTLQRDYGITPDAINDKINQLRGAADLAEREHAAAVPRRDVPETMNPAKKLPQPQPRQSETEREQEREMSRSR
jgi:hypothetical protein